MVNTISNAVGETSGSASNATDLNSEDYSVIDVIYEKLEELPQDQPDRDEFKVRVCHVPKSLSSEKPEAFVPQCVGLGPYHHFHAELLMNDELKLGVAKRVPKVRDLLPVNKEALPPNFVFDNNKIKAFYHEDLPSSRDYLLTVDGLFLLALLHKGLTAIREEPHTYFLTGKPGMPRVNAAGVELTVDGIIGDVFMLENQIPIHVLMKISGGVNSMGIQQENNNNQLGETMLNFCRPLCPLVHSAQVFSPREAEEERVHLLDLMYHFTAPQLVPNCDSASEHEPEHELTYCRTFLEFCTIFLGLCRIFLGVFIIFPLLFILLVFLYLFMYIHLEIIIRWLVRPLFNRAIPWAVGHILGSNPPKMPRFQYLLFPLIDFTFNLQPSDSTDMFEEVLTIPSATKLGKIRIKFKPAEGGILSIKYEAGLLQPMFYLPPIRLDAISEVIIRNLVAYESLTKSHEDLIFTRYIDLMSGLIVTSEDVQLLKHDEIIETQLSDEIVLQLFNGMRSKSIRPTNLSNLEEAVYEVNSKFNYIHTLCWFIVESIRLCVILFTFIVIYPLLMDLFMEVFCLTIFRYTEVCHSRGVGDYGRNISFISSM